MPPLPGRLLFGICRIVAGCRHPQVLRKPPGGMQCVEKDDLFLSVHFAASGFQVIDALLLRRSALKVKKRRTEMAEILLCRHPYSLDSLDDIHDMHSLQLKHKPRTGPPVLIPYRPYLHSAQPSITDHNVMVTLNHHLASKDITDMAFDLGEDNTVAIAHVAAGLRDYPNVA
jgi:hypothetical protein